jgi:hypothetical protein
MNKMHSIGLIGHRSGNFHSNEEISKSKIVNVLEILSFQYGKDLILNVDGETGVGHFAIQEARGLDIKYHIFLPGPVETVGKDWFDRQKQNLDLYFKNSYSTTIASSKCSAQSEKQRDHDLVDCSSFLICFWDGCRQGRTFDIIKYSLATNKLVLNGLDDLKMISNIDIKKRRR